MSVVQSGMFGDQINSFSRGSLRSGSTPFNELLAQFKTRITTQLNNGPSRSPPGFSDSQYVKKRSYSDRANDSESLLDSPPSKRSRTAPPSPPSMLRPSNSFPSDAVLSRLNFAPIHLSGDHPARITLPSLSDALSDIPTLPTRLHKHIVPTVSLDYFDTYKPNDENWRYGLLDSIRSSKPLFNLSNYSYLEKHASSKQAAKSPGNGEKLPSIHDFGSSERPNFDARVSSKALPALAERKINFPYESNYTYLNKTYLTDVERYPEYLELAQSLIQLSRPQQYVAPQPYYPLYKPGYSPKATVESRRAHHHQDHQGHQDHHREIHHHHDQIHHHQDQIHHHHQHDRPKLPHHQKLHHDHQLHQLPDNITSQWASREPHYNYVAASSPARVPQLSPMAYVTPDASFEYKPSSPSKKEKKLSLQRTRFIPITPPSVKDKTRSELMRSPPRASHSTLRLCISCGSDQSPCWRPSWSIKEGQLCNSCGLRYKKTSARCLNDECKKIPAKGEWSLMQTKGKTVFEDGEEAYSCLDCGWKVEVNK